MVVEGENLVDDTEMPLLLPLVNENKVPAFRLLVPLLNENEIRIFLLTLVLDLSSDKCFKYGLHNKL